jgi:hypothetical protein
MRNDDPSPGYVEYKDALSAKGKHINGCATAMTTGWRTSSCAPTFHNETARNKRPNAQLATDSKLMVRREADRQTGDARLLVGEIAGRVEAIGLNAPR